MKLLQMNAVSICSIIGAIALMWLEKDGWGWLMFIAIMFGHTWTNEKNEKDSKKHDVEIFDSVCPKCSCKTYYDIPQK